MGRPRKADKRQHPVNLSLTVSEYQLAKALAETQFTPLSAWLRQEAFRAIEQLLA
jgi:hypothetical protein